MRLIFLCIVFLIGCSNNQYFKTKGLPFDFQEKNIAALFTMTNESGRIENLKMMESIFEDKSLGFEFETHHNKNSKYIYEQLTRLAREVGESGTLLIYLNSHGGGSGSRFGMQASDEFFKFSKALDAIAKGNKVKRLIVLIDTCHASGGIQEGFQGNEKPVINIKTNLPEMPDFYTETIDTARLRNFGLKFETKLEIDYGLSSGAYEESLIVASSSAADLSMRGAFAARLRDAFKQIKNEKDVTVAGFLKKFAELHHNTTQKPHYKVLPSSKLLDEPLFYNLPIREIPIFDQQNKNKNNKYKKDYVPLPSLN